MKALLFSLFFFGSILPSFAKVEVHILKWTPYPYGFKVQVNEYYYPGEKPELLEFYKALPLAERTGANGKFKSIVNAKKELFFDCVHRTDTGADWKVVLCNFDISHKPQSYSMTFDNDVPDPDRLSLHFQGSYADEVKAWFGREFYDSGERFKVIFTPAGMDIQFAQLYTY